MTETEKKAEGQSSETDTRSEIEKLTKENQDLQRALIRSVTIDPQPTSHEPTAEELYQKKIDELSKKSLTIMKNRG